MSENLNAKLPSKNNDGQPLEVEEKILSAARAEFVQFGRKGARMQQIADRAGVNKASLHYYYRSKDKLYEAVLKDIFTQVRSTISRKFSGAVPDNIEQVIRNIVSTYIEVFSRNPQFPIFLMQEVSHSPESIEPILDTFVPFFRQMMSGLHVLLEKGMQTGGLRPIKPEQLLLNVIGMTVGTFIIRPFVQKVGPHLNMDFAYDEEFYNQRKEAIVNMVLHGLQNRGGE
ncbi:TetR/AcrR family transcriptional regulator, partial [Fibrobacterota bacterium]